MHAPVFKRLGLPASPLMLAPLAGVSDHPFRRVCSDEGADLTFVEMISATALLFESRRTLDMLKRHEAEKILGIQITGRTPEEVASAVKVLSKMNFEAIDINMGCPVHKVVKNGCGSAILRDPKVVFRMVELCRHETDKALSVKIRLGWDQSSINALEVADAAEKGGADWLTVHGRTRADDYSVPVDLQQIAAVKRSVKIPIIGNGNIFGANDASYMRETTGVDGLMISRGALGNPWVFKEIKSALHSRLDIQTWADVVIRHLQWQQEEYGTEGKASVCMRKHLLWYSKGWRGSREWRDKFGQIKDLPEAILLVKAFTSHFQSLSEEPFFRDSQSTNDQQQSRFHWDPKWEMDRQLDRAIFNQEIST